MKVKSFLLVCFTFLFLLVITSCFGHECSYSEDWKNDANYHWHVCECGKKEGNAEHTWDAGTIKVAPTENAEGEKIYTCTVCKYEKTEKIEKLSHEHQFEDVAAVAATCENAGNIAYKHCTSCNKNYDAQGNEVTDVVVTALGHTEVVDAAVAPTCEEKGKTEGKHCSVCNKVLVAQEEVAALGHTPVVDAAVAPTCENKGKTEGSHCSVCNEVLVAQEEVAALGHTGGTATCTDKAVCTTCEQPYGELDVNNHSHSVEWSKNETNHWHECECGDKKDNATHTWNQGEVVTEATEEVEGEVKYTCTVCEYSYIENTGVLEHTHKFESVWSKNETHHWYASTCGHDVSKDKAEHEYTWTTLTEATCEAAEVLKGVCACGHETTKAGQAALGHTSVVDEAVAPDCENTGLTEGSHCSACNTVLVAQEEVAALGHTSAVDAAVAPDCENTGLTEGSHCSVCNTVLVAQEEVEALGHTSVVDAAVAPDCENTGLTEGSHCSVCNTVLVAQEEVAALGHAYSDWVIVPSTFDEEGSKTRSCTCGHSDEETIPVLVKASSVSYENEKIELYVNSSENISVVVGPETAENYVVEWISNDQSILKVEGNGLNAVITSKSTLAKVAITVKVTNILNDVEYNTVETTIEVYIYPSPIVEYTFENGIVNEGTASNVTASLLSNVTDTRYQEVTDASYLINKFDTTVLKGDHNGTGNSFGIKGIETGSGDFTITAKYAVASNVEDIYNKANQYYVMGTASETITGNKPAKPCFAITLGKDSKSAGYLRTTVTLNGETKLLYISNQAGYFKSNSLVEFVIVKEGTKVTVSIICPEVEGQAKCCSYSVEFELASAEDFMITNDQVLGFACNYGATRPGNSSYYDDICIYDYAVNEHMFIDYTSDNNATCSSNGTETATCVYCDETHTREELNSKLDHTFENYVSDNNATCHSNCTETAKCKNCDAIDTKEIADSTLEHTFTVYISNGDGTQTAKCENCDATDTKEEILTCQHEFSSNYAYNGEYHWLPCTKCEEVVDPKSHEISNWSITTNPTFETEGSKTRSCLCGYSEEDSISELVKVTSAELSASSLQIYAGDLSNYSLTVNVKSSTEKTPDSYRVAWEISGDSVAAMEAEGVICALTINGTLGTASVKVTVSNVLGEEVVDTYEATFTLTVLKAPIVRYTFDNGQIVNTGTDQTVNGRVTTLNDDKTAIVDVEDLSGVSYTTDASGVANGAIVLNNTGKGNHFTISGLDLGTGDFTITTKIYMSKLTSKTDSSNYLFGIGDKKDVADGYFNFAFKKNGSYSQVRLRLNGTTNWADYAPHQKWVEYTIVREGNKITVYVDQGCDKNGNLKTTIKEFTLTSDASIDFTNCNLGFSSNIGCQDPGDFPIYYDDIMVFDYALYPVS